MKDQTNEEQLDPVPGELPDTAGRPGAASAFEYVARYLQKTALDASRIEAVDDDGVSFR